MSAVPLAEWQGEPLEHWRVEWGVPRVEIYASVGSTNDRALALATDGGNGFAVVIADEQTRGRGRRGAAWHSPAGAGLWMSVVLPWKETASHVTLLVGLAVAEAIELAAPGVRVGIKWPNDVWIGGRKVGGILCESTGGGVVAGIGLNLLAAATEGLPLDLIDRVTSLQVESGKALSRSVLVGFIVRALRSRLAAGSGLDGTTLRELSARDVLARCAVATDEHGPGIALGIGADGALLLERPGGSRVRVMAGSVRPL